jgi:cytochrome oxidase assembly protein ShyY1
MSARLQFDLEWRTTAFTLVLLPVLISLGFWQLQRADEKAALGKTWEARQVQPAVPVEAVLELAPQALAYLPVSASGRYEQQRYFLLDNRSRDRQFGYEVLALFRPASGAPLLLVNRGWVAGDASRLSLPQIPAAQQQSLAGYVYVAPGEPYLLAEQQLVDEWPQRLQAVDAALIAQLLGEPVFPYPVRLHDDQPDALLAQWAVVNVSPEKHTGYAVQWFSMALALVIIFIFRSSNLGQLLRPKGGR